MHNQLYENRLYSEYNLLLIRCSPLLNILYIQSLHYIILNISSHYIPFENNSTHWKNPLQSFILLFLILLIRKKDFNDFDHTKYIIRKGLSSCEIQYLILSFIIEEVFRYRFQYNSNLTLLIHIMMMTSIHWVHSLSEK